MRLVLSRNDPSTQPDTAAGDHGADQPRNLPQPELFSEAEREALHNWASKHGFALRNPVDEQLAAVVWRETLTEKPKA